jgi:contact-dependent growth inhibition (CDI) system CdiI-like immunity protein
MFRKSADINSSGAITVARAYAECHVWTTATQRSYRDDLDNAAVSTMVDEHRTLEELDGENWGEPDTAPTSMVAKCMRLRRTPLNALGQGDLRLLIRQKIGLKYAVPRALESICANALLEAEFYPGDLLCALLRLDKDYWSQNPDDRKRLVAIAESVAKQYGRIVDDCESFLTANRGQRETLD